MGASAEAGAETEAQAETWKELLEAADLDGTLELREAAEPSGGAGEGAEEEETEADAEDSEADAEDVAAEAAAVVTTVETEADAEAAVAAGWAKLDAASKAMIDASNDRLEAEMTAAKAELTVAMEQRKRAKTAAAEEKARAKAAAAAAKTAAKRDGSSSSSPLAKLVPPPVRAWFGAKADKQQAERFDALYASANADPTNFVKQDTLLRELVVAERYEECVERFEVGGCTSSIQLTGNPWTLKCDLLLSKIASKFTVI
jgi:hypothetical protein